MRKQKLYQLVIRRKDNRKSKIVYSFTCKADRETWIKAISNKCYLLLKREVLR